MHRFFLLVKADLDALERRWRKKLENQQRDTAKKAAAAAAAAAAAGRNHFGTNSRPHPPGGLHSLATEPGTGRAPLRSGHNEVTRTASWLDRANAILSNQPRSNGSLAHVGTAADPTSRMTPGVTTTTVQQLSTPTITQPPSEIESQMKEVQQLIHEGPIIKQTTAGLTTLLNKNGTPHSSPSESHNREEMQEMSQTSRSPGSSPPRDKRARRLSGAEDAEALVDFLNSVRASAAAAAAASQSPPG